MRVEKELDETDFFFFFDINQVKDSIKIKRLKEWTKSLKRKFCWNKWSRRNELKKQQLYVFYIFTDEIVSFKLAF